MYRRRNLLFEQDLNSSTITKYFCAGDLRVAKIVCASTCYFHQDHLGITRLVTTSAASDSFSSNYKPFGPPYGGTGSETFKYVGQREASVTGLYAMGAWYYSPTVAGFIIQDPILRIPLHSQSLNCYSFCVDRALRAQPLFQSRRPMRRSCPMPPFAVVCQLKTSTLLRGYSAFQRFEESLPPGPSATCPQAPLLRTRYDGNPARFRC